jgi:hypothetical protein
MPPSKAVVRKMASASWMPQRVQEASRHAEGEAGMEAVEGGKMVMVSRVTDVLYAPDTSYELTNTMQCSGISGTTSIHTYRVICSHFVSESTADSHQALPSPLNGPETFARCHRSAPHSIPY